MINKHKLIKMLFFYCCFLIIIFIYFSMYEIIVIPEIILSKFYNISFIESNLGKMPKIDIQDIPTIKKQNTSLENQKESIRLLKEYLESNPELSNWCKITIYEDLITIDKWGKVLNALDSTSKFGIYKRQLAEVCAQIEPNSFISGKLKLANVPDPNLIIPDKFPKQFPVGSVVDFYDKGSETFIRIYTLGPGTVYGYWFNCVYDFFLMSCFNSLLVKLGYDSW